MARLIDADALKERFSNMYRDDYEEWIKSIIDKAPTVPDRYNEGYVAGVFAVLNAVAEENEEDNNG